MSPLTREREARTEKPRTMALTRTQTYDRKRILEQAARAARRRRARRAVSLYRRVLAVEPGNPELLEKLAPLLARAGQDFDAWLAFKAAAQARLQQGRVDRALAVWYDATRALPRRIDAWLALAELERQRGRRDAALSALLAGRRCFRGRRWRAHAIHLLRQARRLRPGDVEVALELARLLAVSGQGAEAELLLAELARRSQGPALRRVRAAHWRIAPSLQHTWLWLRAAV